MVKKKDTEKKNEIEEELRNYKIIPSKETYSIVTGDPRIIGSMGGVSTNGLLSKMIFDKCNTDRKKEMLEFFENDLGLIGHFSFYAKEDRESQRKLISIFRKDMIEDIKGTMMGRNIITYSKLYPLFGYLYYGKDEESISDFIIDNDIAEEIIPKKALKKSNMKMSDIIAIQWLPDITFASILDISLLDPNFNITVKPIRVKDENGRVAVYEITATHHLILESYKDSIGFSRYNPEDIAEYYKNM